MGIPVGIVLFGEYFTVAMEEKVLPIEVWRWGQYFGPVCLRFFLTKIYFFVKKITFFIFDVFVSDFHKNHFVKKIIFESKMKSYFQQILSKSIFFKTQTMCLFSKMIFIMVNKHKTTLDFFQNLYKIIYFFKIDFFKKIYFILISNKRTHQ